MEKEQVVYKTWKEVVSIPNWMVLEITDAGREEYYANDIFIDSDDLHIAIIIFGGHKILIPGNSRIVIKDNGDFSIQMLKPDERR